MQGRARSGTPLCLTRLLPHYTYYAYYPPLLLLHPTTPTKPHYAYYATTPIRVYPYKRFARNMSAGLFMLS